jgi:hypothetical protein
MSTPEKQLGLTELSGDQVVREAEDVSVDVSFTSEDNEAIHDELFSGESGERARVIVLKIVLGEFADEQEKESLIDEFEKLTREAAEAHLQRREE